MKILIILPVSLLFAWSAFANTDGDGEWQLTKTCHINATAMNLTDQVREYYLNNCIVSNAYGDQPTNETRKQCQINAAAMNLEGNTRYQYLASCLASQ